MWRSYVWVQATEYWMERIQGVRRSERSRYVTHTVQIHRSTYNRPAIELWRIFHDELDLDGNGHLDAEELTVALDKAGKEACLYYVSSSSLTGPSGIVMTPSKLSEFMTFMTSTPHSHAISFQEFRDFFLLMPRKASPAEIFRYYEVRKFMGEDGRGAARVNMEGEPVSPLTKKPFDPDHTFCR